MYCNHCGTPIPPNARECPNCHAAVSAPQYQPGPDQSSPTMIVGATPPTYVPPTYAPPTYTPPTMQTPPAPKKKAVKPAVIVAVVAAVLLILCLLVVLAIFLLQPAWLPFDLPKLGGGGSSGAQSTDYIVGYLQSYDEYDLAWIHGKDETVLYEDAILDVNYNGISYVEDGKIKEYLWSSVDFMPTDPGTLLVRTMDDTDTVVLLRDLKKETETELFKTSYTFNGYLLKDGTFIFVENRTESVRAYVSDGKTEAERVLKADYISYLPALNNFMATTIDGEEVTYQLYDLEGNEISTLYSGESLSNWVINADGSLMVAVRLAGEGVEVVSIDPRSGEEISVNDTYTAIAGLVIASEGNLVYMYGEDEDGFLNLEATTNGEWVLLAEGARKLAAVANGSATQLAYISTDEDGANTLFVADVKTAESEEIFSSDDSLTLMSETKIADTFFITEVVDVETTLYRCSFKGGEPVALIEDSEAGMSYINGMSGVMSVSLYDSVNSTNSLWVMPEKGNEGYMLLEEWYSVYVAAVSPNGSQLILNGTEDMGDDPVLYLIDVEEGAEPVEIDDDFTSLWSAFFSSDGKTLLYNAAVGDNYDDYEVRSVNLSDKELPIETLYEEARIISTGWDTFDYNAYWYSYTIYASQGSGVTRLSTGQTATGTLGGEIYEARYNVNLEVETLYRIVVKADPAVNPAVTLYDKDGMQLTYKNDYYMNDESVFFTPPSSGAFQIGISDTNYGSNETEFTVELVVIPAEVITPGQTVNGELSSADAYQVGDQTLYLRFFLMPAKANDYVTITLDGMGTDVPFSLNLMDSYYYYQNGTYGYGATTSLYHTFYYDGMYILSVSDDSTFYGMTTDFSKDYSFTIQVYK